MGNLHASSCGEPKWGRGYFEQASELAREEERERRREREKKREREREKYAKFGPGNVFSAVLLL